MPQASSTSLYVLLVIVGLLLVTVWLYAPALDFGFIWDDPLWYGRVVGKPIGALVKPMTDYQYYRPGTMLYNRLFLRSDGTFPAPLMHAIQIGWHLVNVVLILALSRRLGLERWAAVAVGGLVAWYPFSHQAVAWAAPQQPLVGALQNSAWLAYVEARRRQEGRPLMVGLSLLFFLIALSVQESTAVLAMLPLLMEWVLGRRGAGEAGRRLPWVYLLVAGGFGLLWLWLPRQAGYTSLALEPSVVLYLLQGFIFPLLGRPAGYAPSHALAPTILLALAGLTVVGLLAAAWRAGWGRQALFGWGWALLGIAPSLVGLQYSYVSLAPRLLYYSSPGVALLWACALLPRGDGSWLRRLWRIGGVVALGLVALQSGLLVVGFQRMYAVGTTHLTELIQVAEKSEARMLFVNFPDRYAPSRPPYPLGYWGVTLAPVSVDLGAFPASLSGRHPRTASRSMPWIDADARDAGPYRIDLRGEIATADRLYELARQMDAVYLSRYMSDGAFALQWAGAVSSVAPSTSSCQLAIFGQALCLQDAQVEWEPGRAILTLDWLSLSAAQPHDTVFVHVGPVDRPPIAQADGDAWLGMLPLTVWQPGDTIREQRIIPLSEGGFTNRKPVRVGVYNRLTGERLPAATPQGEPLPDNAITIGYLP